MAAAQPSRPTGRRCASLARTVARVLVRRVTPDAQTLVCADVLHVRRRDLVGPGGSWGACAPKSRAAGRLALPPAPSEPGPHRVAPRLLRSAGEVRAPPLPVGLPLGLAPLRTYCVRYGGWWIGPPLHPGVCVLVEGSSRGAVCVVVSRADSLLATFSRVAPGRGPRAPPLLSPAPPDTRTRTRRRVMCMES